MDNELNFNPKQRRSTSIAEENRLSRYSKEMKGGTFEFDSTDYIGGGSGGGSEGIMRTNTGEGGRGDIERKESLDFANWGKEGKGKRRATEGATEGAEELVRGDDDIAQFNLGDRRSARKTSYF